MSLYLCSACGCWDNTGLTDYWVRQSMRLPALCSDCSPGLVWHGHWEKESARGMLIDRRGFLWRPQELMQIRNLEIVGVVPDSTTNPKGDSDGRATTPETHEA